MAPRKVPAFLSKKFNSLSTREEKIKLLDDYEIWKLMDITKSYILHLEEELERAVKEDEDKTDWLSWFSFKYTQAHNKGKRSFIRKLLHTFK